MSRLAHNFFKVGCPRTCNFFQGASLWSCYCTPPHRASYIQGPRHTLQDAARRSRHPLRPWLACRQCRDLDPCRGSPDTAFGPFNSLDPNHGHRLRRSRSPSRRLQRQTLRVHRCARLYIHYDKMAMYVESHASRSLPSMLLPSMLPASLSTAAEGGPELGCASTRKK